MEKKYINESRYKKGTVRKRRDVNTVKSKLKSDKVRTVKVKEKTSPKKNTTPVKKKTNKIAKENKVKNIVTCIILLIIIAVISRAILKDENEPFIPLPFITPSNDEVVTIGVITTDSLLKTDANNIVLNELNKYSKNMLLEINADYSITYRHISSVEKVSNKEYVLTKNEKSKAEISEIKSTIENYINNKNAAYYNKLSNISSVTVIDENRLNIKLKKDDAYFVYNLDIPVVSSSGLTNYVQDSLSSENKLVFNRRDDANRELPLKIVVLKYKDMYAAVEAYKENEISMFVTNAENATSILGKYEYNIKTYRNGQSVFLFANPNSKIYAKEEVRKAIAYSIDRDGIIKDVLKSKGIKIDLPYIYDETKYKYDVYAAENLLLTAGYKKTNKVYSKTEKGIKTTLELDLIVNKEDSIKVSIANRIKSNLNAIGIKINVEKLTEAKMKSRINKGDYDLVLASVNLNNNPDIAFAKSNLFVTDKVTECITTVENSTVQDLSKNILSLQSTLSQEIAAIGIYSDMSYLVYSKDIIGIDTINYLNLFKDIFG